MGTPEPTPEAVVETFLAAYNANDLATLERVLHPDVHVVHHGTTFDVHGRGEVLRRFAANAEGDRAARRFLPARRRLTSGEHVVLEHVFRSAEGELTELCTILTVRDGVLTEYVEYG